MLLSNWQSFSGTITLSLKAHDPTQEDLFHLLLLDTIVKQLLSISVNHIPPVLVPQGIAGAHHSLHYID